MRILVCGGAGFIGSTFVERRLAATDDRITVLDALTYAGGRDNLAAVESDPGAAQRFAFVQGDVADGECVRPLVARADAVINFAAESHVDRSILDSEAGTRTNVMGVDVLLGAVRAADEEDGRARRLVQVSTDEVYGPCVGAPHGEDAPLRPRSPYAASKAAGDLLALAHQHTHGLDVVITRGVNTYGPRQHPEKLIPLFTTNGIEGLPMPLYGDGLQRRDWLHVTDHADAVGVALDHGVAGGVYNIAAGQERSNVDVTAAILDALGGTWDQVRHIEDRAGHDRRYAIDGSRLQALGWAPTTAFGRGIAATVAWYRDNEEWWRRRRDPAWERYYARQYGRRAAASPAR